MNKKQAILILVALYLTSFLAANTLDAQARETLTIQIQPPPRSTTLQIYDTITLTAQATGGPGGYNYQWYLNDTAINNSTLETYTYTATQMGIADIKCTATDATGTIPDTATSQTITLTISAKAATAPPLVGAAPPQATQATDNITKDTNQTQTLTVVIVGAVIIFVIAVAAIVVMKQRKSKK